MKKIIFGIFAHPDDEAFGPSGALLQETRSGAELHLVTLTLGDAGTNPDGHDNLAAVREQEWRAAGQLLGAKSMTFLGYKDGQLCNRDMIEIGQNLLEMVQKILENTENDAKVELVTFDLNGISGHIDHIVAARAATWAFYTLKKTDSRLQTIKYACLPASLAPETNIDWLYMEAGRPDSEINEIVDARGLKDEVIAIMRRHHSQRGDGEAHIKNRGDDLGLNYFVVRT